MNSFVLNKTQTPYFQNKLQVEGWQECGRDYEPKIEGEGNF